MRNYLYKIVVLGLCVDFLSACKTTDRSDHPKMLDGEDTAVELGPDAASDNTVPSFLWSPSRRRATAGYYFIAAEYMAMEGKFKNARPIYEFAYGLDPNPFLGAKLIAAQAGVGDFDKALPEAQKLVLLYPKSPQLHFLYGQLLAQKGMTADSIEEIERSITLEPTREEYYLELANIHQQNKELPKAIVVLKEYLERNPSSVAGMVKLAKLYLATSQKKEALGPARRAYEIDSTNPEIVLVYALSLETNEQSEKALGLYEQLYRMDPTNEELIARMIELYRTIGDLNQSLELLSELAELPGGSRPGIQLQRAIILWELKRFEEAATILEGLAKEFPQQDRLLYMAGLGQEKLKQLDAALKHYSNIPDNSQFSHHAKFRSALILKEKKDYDKALALLETIKDAKEGADDVYILCANIYGDLERYSDSVKVLDEGIEKSQEKGRLLFMKGVFQEKNKDLKGCIETMRAVIAADPENSSAYNYLGYLFAERNEQLDEAEKLISKALTLKPNDGYYLDSLAWVFYQKKDYKTALKNLELAVVQVPDEGVIFEHFGDVYKAIGQKKKALGYYEKAAKARLEKRDQDRVEGKLKSLKEELTNTKAAEH